MVPLDSQKSQGMKPGSAAFPGEPRGSAAVLAARSPGAALGSLPDTLRSALWGLCFPKASTLPLKIALRPGEGWFFTGK